ncbi:MAG: helix-turn-helix transcriptional regulator [Opitutales bacterium]|nr:helix-turn-helix transcriptional regulator [Opitutales bacterium]
MKVRVTNVLSNAGEVSPKEIQHISSGYEFYLFQSDAIINLPSEISEVKYGDCILYGENDQVDIKASGEPLECSLISYKSADCKKLLSEIDFEVSKIYRPVQTYFVDSILDKITKEYNAKDLHFDKALSIHIQELLLKIFRFVRQDFVLSLPDHAQKLRELRTEVHENFPKRWTIENMSQIMGLSASRFASLYKQIFNISPTEDLIRTRIDQSKKILSTTKVSIKKVSAACGFESVHYFHRAFKKRIGITPKHFQNKMLTNQGSVPVDQNEQSLDSMSLTSDFSGTLEIINGEIVFHGNDSDWSKFLGYSTDHLNDKPFMNLISDDDLDKAKGAVNSIVNGKNVFNVNLSLIAKNGDSLPINFSAISRGNSIFCFVKSELVIIA